MTDVQSVAGAGVIHVIARVVGYQPVISEVVDAPKTQHRTEMIAFGGMVVNHVENHLDALRWSVFTMALNSPTWAPVSPLTSIALRG